LMPFTLKVAIFIRESVSRASVGWVRAGDAAVGAGRCGS